MSRQDDSTTKIMTWTKYGLAVLKGSEGSDHAEEISEDVRKMVRSETPQPFVLRVTPPSTESIEEAVAFTTEEI